MIIYNGKQYARVSDILKPFSDFSHIDPEVLKNKAELGTRVHLAINDDINNEFPFIGEKERGYFESYLRWKERLSPTFSMSERRLYCQDKSLTGQIDCLINIPSKLNLPVLVDFKTSAQEAKETWPMQAHLYNYLLSMNQILVGPRYLFVKLSKNGQLPEVFEYMWNANTHLRCMHAIELYWKTQKDENNPFS